MSTQQHTTLVRLKKSCLRAGTETVVNFSVTVYVCVCVSLACDCSWQWKHHSILVIERLGELSRQLNVFDLVITDGHVSRPENHTLPVCNVTI